MTLVGLLPPLCDNGNLLVDGGYSKWMPNSYPSTLLISVAVDNLPVLSCSLVIRPALNGIPGINNVFSGRKRGLCV
jgi:hypothetical protein